MFMVLTLEWLKESAVELLLTFLLFVRMKKTVQFPSKNVFDNCDNLNLI